MVCNGVQWCAMMCAMMCANQCDKEGNFGPRGEEEVEEGGWVLW